MPKTLQLVQWSFRKTGTVGTQASQAELGAWVQASACVTAAHGLCLSLPGVGAGGGRLKILSLAMRNLGIRCIFGRKMVRNAVHNAFVNTLTVRTSFPCIPTAFHQWEWRPQAFLLERTPESVTITFHQLKKYVESSTLLMSNAPDTYQPTNQVFLRTPTLQTPISAHLATRLISNSINNFSQ